MCKYIPGMVAADPNASGVPERPKRQRAEPDEEPDEEPEDLHSKRARAAEAPDTSCRWRSLGLGGGRQGEEGEGGSAAQ